MTDHHHGHDHHAHDHGHGHGHGHHHHVPAGTSTAGFALAIGLNSAFVLAEGIAGLTWNSMALLADAGHNLSDVMALAVSWGAARLAARPPSRRFTWGLKSSSILAALANSALLWVAIGAILIETLRRLVDPVAPGGVAMMIVAGIGIAVNGLSALMFAGKDDLNLRAAFQHLMADAVVSAGVVAAGALVVWTHQPWIDPVTSLVVIAVIAAGSWSLLREAVMLGLDAVPAGIDEQAVSAFLGGRPGVERLHDLHIWPMSTTETALTVHLVMPAGHPGDAFLHDLAGAMAHQFRIGHVTLQVETGCEACLLEPAETV